MRTKTFTTKSGEDFTLIPVSQSELIPFMQKYAPSMPQPPVETVQTAAGPKEIVNENNPEYKKAVEAFEMEHGVFLAAAVIELGLDVVFTVEQQDFINRRKKKLEKLFPEARENQLDTYVYLKMACSDEEFKQISDAIMTINNPTAQQVQAHLDAFRPGVQGSPDNENKDTPKWNKFQERELEFNSLPGSEALEDRPNPVLREIRPRVAG